MVEEVKKSNYSISDIYQGGYSSLDPDYGISGFDKPIPTGQFGLTTDPRVADVLKEVSSKLSTGVKDIEIEGLQPQILESMPKQHLKEVGQLAKLTGIEITLHGPLVDASGLTREGFSEAGREQAERQILMALERSHELNPKGNTPVTFHSAIQLPGQIMDKSEDHPNEVLVINSETGAINRLSVKERKELTGEKKSITPQGEVDFINQENWKKQIKGLMYYSDLGDDHLRQTEAYKQKQRDEREKFEQAKRLKQEGKLKEIDLQEKEFEDQQKQVTDAINSQVRKGERYYNDSYRELEELFNVAYKKVELPGEKKLIDDFYKQAKNRAKSIVNSNNPEEVMKIKKELIDEGIDVLNKVNPQLFESLNEFAKEKTVQTFGNAAWKAYEKVRSKEWEGAPIISIENPPAGQSAFSRGSELKEIVEKSREKFVERAVQEGISKTEAQKQAEKLIGVTWDVGHINMLRKFGYDDEDILKETKEIAPLVKHVHLSDNFGFEHTELPMGMGNVPIAGIMKNLGKKGFEAKKIIEAGNWWQHFKSPPVGQTFEAFGSPYSTSGGGGNWGQGNYEGYYSGFGMMLPQTNYATFGAGFSQLPAELGGQQQGGQGSRMSGRPME